MANQGMGSILTPTEVGEQLDWSYARVRTLLADVEPALSTAGGRFRFYSKESVVEALYAHNEKILKFMGFLPPAESYDIVTKSDAPASE
jgi:hypothetical protein